MRDAANGSLRAFGVHGGIRLSPVMSSIIHTPAFLARNWTEVIDPDLTKVIGWYDNEWGYSARTADLIARVAKLL